MKKDYLPPVSDLLTYGDARNRMREWPNYLDLGLTKDHVDDLIRLATDDDIYYSTEPGDLCIWAPIHARRALAQLQAHEVADRLLEQLYKIDDEDDDWINEEYPDIFKMLGPQTIPALDAYLRSTHDGLFAKVCAANCLEKIGNSHPESRSHCIKILADALEQHASNDPGYNGFLTAYLVDLKAVEVIKTIQKAFFADDVDPTVVGDLEDVEIALGVRLRRATPPPRFEMVDDSSFRTAPPLQTPKKIGRNDPCPCGSGKKYKKCCLK